MIRVYGAPILPRLVRHKLLILLIAAAPLAGCGSSPSATLVLDFTPNAVHAGIYSAIRRGFTRLHVVIPSSTTDSVKLLQTGKAQFAILDIHDLAIARERGRDVVAVMAIVQRPLASVIAAPQIRSPRELAGRAVGVTGVPSDTAVLDSVVAGSGGDPKRVKTITIGFDAVAALLAGRVAAATAFWNDEGVTLARRRPGFHVFRVDRYGAPPYPELVLCATRSTVDRDPSLVRSTVQALERGYRATVSDPRTSESDLESQVQGLDPQLVDAELRALLPALAPRGFDPGALAAWARWEARFGIVHRPPDIARAFDRRFAAG
jgi:NitT/TauT family transport system substrate-binding protein/putative hydroxymethylpyrimidine transport system substrate-binding protein